MKFNWNILPVWANDYIAMDMNGTWYSYDHEPKISTPYNWSLKGISNIIRPPNEPEGFSGDWKKYLFKNPNK